MTENGIDTSDASFGFHWAGQTHIGKLREENQDTFFADPDVPLFLVADGMGGHRGGALASKTIAENLPVMIENALARLKVGAPATIRALLKKTIAEQSRQLHLEGTSEAGFKDMGATIVLALLRHDRCFIANLGDSRAYLLRNQRLTQLTRDHSVVSELIEQGRINPEDAGTHRALGQITRYVGMEEKTVPHIRSFTLKKADRILLCTDGLTDMLEQATLAELLKNHSQPKQACCALVSAANDAGGYDNITALVIDWWGPQFR